MNAPNRLPRVDKSPEKEQLNVLPVTDGLHNPPVPGRKRLEPDKKLAGQSAAASKPKPTPLPPTSAPNIVIPNASPWPREPLPLAVLMEELKGCEPNPSALRHVAESLRKECEVVAPGDRVLDFKVAHGRMYCAVLSETQAATHNSGSLRLIVVSIDLDNKVVWETVVRLPLSAPDCHGLCCLAGKVMGTCITPVVEWLARFHGLTQKCHGVTLRGLSNPTNPSIK